MADEARCGLTECDGLAQERKRGHGPGRHAGTGEPRDDVATDRRNFGRLAQDEESLAQIESDERRIRSHVEFIELTPGPHRIKIYFAYMGMDQCGANSVDINVLPGTFVRVSYYMWPWMFSPGQMTVSQ